MCIGLVFKTWATSKTNTKIVALQIVVTYFLLLKMHCGKFFATELGVCTLLRAPN